MQILTLFLNFEINSLLIIHFGVKQLMIGKTMAVVDLFV